MPLIIYLPLVIVDALLRGKSDGMDIMTLSLGGVAGWTEGTASVVASRLVDQGKVLTIAAGNDGSFGSWYTSGPGNGIDVISYVFNFNFIYSRAKFPDPRLRIIALQVWISKANLLLIVAVSYLHYSIALSFRSRTPQLRIMHTLLS